MLTMRVHRSEEQRGEEKRDVPDIWSSIRQDLLIPLTTCHFHAAKRDYCLWGYSLLPQGRVLYKIIGPVNWF